VRNPPLADLHESFSRHLRAEGKAPRTIAIYGQSITYFSAWLAEQGKPATLDQLTRANAVAWFGGLLDRGLQPGTVRTRAKGLGRFSRWLVAEDELPADPLAGLEAPEARFKPVPVLSDEDLAKLLKTCTSKDFRSRRDAALFRVLLDCGARISEVVGLEVGHVDLKREMAVVTGKGSRSRPVYFSARTVRALDQYLRVRVEHRWAHMPALFLSQRGAMTADGARERLTVRAAEAGLAHIHPHQFRHTFAHDYLMNGGQERDLKRLAGWSSDVMLERYGASAADARAREATRRMGRGDRV
jgi:site-specific recombinase XerD